MNNKMEYRYVIADDIGELNEFPPSSQTSSTTIPLHVHSSRRTMLKAGLGLPVAATGAGTWLGLHRRATSAKQQTDNVVIQWNSAALQAIGNTATGLKLAHVSLPLHILACMTRGLSMILLCLQHVPMVFLRKSPEECGEVCITRFSSTSLTQSVMVLPCQKDKWKDVTEAVSYAGR